MKPTTSKLNLQLNNHRLLQYTNIVLSFQQLLCNPPRYYIFCILATFDSFTKHTIPASVDSGSKYRHQNFKGFPKNPHIYGVYVTLYWLFWAILLLNWITLLSNTKMSHVACGLRVLWKTLDNIRVFSPDLIDATFLFWQKNSMCLIIDRTSSF